MPGMALKRVVVDCAHWSIVRAPREPVNTPSVGRVKPIAGIEMPTLVGAGMVTRYQTESRSSDESLQAVGSSAAAVAPVISAVTVVGSDVIAVAALKSSLAGGFTRRRLRAMSPEPPPLNALSVWK